MTIAQISKTLKHAAKPSSRLQVHRYIRAVGILPVGARQRPQQYPDGTDKLILAHLGANHYPVAPIVRARNNGTAWKTPRAKLPTMSQLRAERQKARGGK